VTPDSAVSGQKFRIKVEAYDRYNNVVKNFNLTGLDVLLSTSGNGSLSPAKLAPPDFINGIAAVDVMYDRAESFQISARMASERLPGRVSVRDHEVKREVSHAPVRSDGQDLSKPAETPPKISKKEEVKGSAEVKQDKPLQTVKKQSPKPESIKEPARPAKEVKKTEPKKEAPKKAAPKKEELKKEALKKEAPKPAVVEMAKKPATPQQSVSRKEVPPAKPVEKKIEKPPADEQKKPPVETAKKKKRRLINCSIM